MKLLERLLQEQEDQVSEPSLNDILHYLNDKFNLKVVLFLLVLLFLSTGIFYWDYYEVNDEQKSLHVLLETIASSFFVAAVVGGTYEMFVRRETEKKLKTTLRIELGHSRREEEARLKELIPDVLLLNSDVQKTALERNLVEDIVLVGLETVLGSRDLAEFAYEGLIKKIVGFEEKWLDYRQEFTLSRLGEKYSPDIQDKYYRLTIDMGYDTVLQSTSFSLACIGSKAKFRDFVRERICNYNYGLPTSQLIPQITREFFNLRDITVSSSDQTLGLGQFEANEHSEEDIFEIRISSADLEKLVGSPVRIHYILETLISKQSQILSVPILFPSRGVKISLDYADTDISRVSLYHYLVSRLEVKPVLLPENPHRIYLESKEWVFPGSGMIFVWKFPIETASETSDEPESALVSETNPGHSPV